MRAHPYRTAVISAVGIFALLVKLGWRHLYKIPAWSTRFGNYVLGLAQNHPHLARILHVILNAVPDAVPLFLALAGLVYLMPRLAKRIESSGPLRVGIAVLFILFALLAIGVNAINREAQEHKSDDEDSRIKSVEATNEQILKAVVSPPLDESQPARMYRVEEVLRNKFILTHTDISPDILAKTAWPPTAWMNQQLELLHENFKFAEPAPKQPTVIQQIAPEPKQAQIGVSFYNDDVVRTPSHNIEVVVDPVDQVTFSVDIAAYGIGDTAAKNVKYWIRVCGGCAWASEPKGSSSVPEKPLDRQFVVSEVLPNVSIPKITLEVKRPPAASPIYLGFYYTCDNCAPLDSTKPIPLVITFPTPLAFPVSTLYSTTGPSMSFNIVSRNR